VNPITQAQRYIDAGDQTAARAVLAQLLQRDKDNETAWLMLAGLLDDPDKRRHCYQQALRINPNNGRAKAALAPPRQSRQVPGWLVAAVTAVFGLLCLCSLAFLMLPRLFDSPSPPAAPATQPPAASRTPAASDQLRMNGNGGDVWDLETGGGVYVVNSQHSGERNFIMTVYDKESGALVDIAANCIANCQDSTVVRLDPGEYLVEITADGRWSASWNRQ
jgi:hypothetical protein